MNGSHFEPQAIEIRMINRLVDAASRLLKCRSVGSPLEVASGEGMSPGGKETDFSQETEMSS